MRAAACGHCRRRGQPRERRPDRARRGGGCPPRLEQLHRLPRD